MRGAVRGTVVELLARGCGLAAGEQFERVVVCGHSLGGALATLCASDLAGYLGAKCAVSSYTFGSPRVGNAVFASEYAAR
jgi:triacylglycerol lipase